MTIAGPDNPVWFVVRCRMCDHLYEERVCGKTTSVCPKCSTPMEVYADGRTAPSALFEVRGEVVADRGQRFDMGRGLFVATREWFRKRFNKE